MSKQYGDIELQNGAKVTGGTTPSNDTDLVTKGYVDSLSAGLDPKESCRLATTADLDTIGNGTWVQSGIGVGATLTAGAAGSTTIDTIVLTDGLRILVKDQSTAKENGIYVASATGAGSATILTRATDQDGSPSSEVSGGNYTFIEQGSTHAGDGFTVVAPGIINIDVDSMNWSQLSSAGGGLVAVVDDATPQLGGDLDTNGSDIVFGTSDNIVGDFSNASRDLRTAFVSGVTDTSTVVQAKPNGTAVGAYFVVGNANPITDCETMIIGTTGTESFIDSGAFGTGTARDLLVKVGGSEKLKIETDGTLSVSNTTNYETLVIDDDDIPNKKYVDDNAGGGGLNDVVEDLTPQLGGDLDLNSKNISFDGTTNNRMHWNSTDSGIDADIGGDNITSVRTDGLWVFDDGGSGATIWTSSASSTVGSGGRLGFTRSRGSLASPGNVLNSDNLGEIHFNGYTGGDFRFAIANLITKMADTGTLSATSAPTEMGLYTTPDGSLTSIKRLRIESDGTLSVGDTAGYNALVTDNDDIPNKKYVDDNSIGNVVDDLTPQLGGDLDVNSNTITGLPDAPAVDSEATSKKYVDDSFSTATGAVTSYALYRNSAAQSSDLGVGGTVVLNSTNHSQGTRISRTGSTITLQPGSYILRGSLGRASWGGNDANVDFAFVDVSGSPEVEVGVRGRMVPEDRTTSAGFTPEAVAHVTVTSTTTYELQIVRLAGASSLNQISDSADQAAARVEVQEVVNSALEKSSAQYTNTSEQTTNLDTGDTIVLNSTMFSKGTKITRSGSTITLQPGSYKMVGYLGKILTTLATTVVDYGFYNISGSPISRVGVGARMTSDTRTANAGFTGVDTAYITVATATDIELRLINSVGAQVTAIGANSYPAVNVDIQEV